MNMYLEKPMLRGGGYQMEVAQFHEKWSESDKNWNLGTFELSWAALKISGKFLDEKYFFSHSKVGDNVISLITRKGEI